MKQRRKQSAEICLLTEKILQLELYILYLCIGKNTDDRIFVSRNVVL